MSDLTSCQQWVEAIRRLKEKHQHCLGSLTAYRCLKAHQWFADVRRSIESLYPALESHHDLSDERLAYYVAVIKSMGELMLQGQALEASSPTACSLGSHHAIEAPIWLCHEGSDVGLPVRSLYRHQWSLDFPRVIGECLSAVACNQPEAVLAWLELGFMHGTLVLVYVATNQEVPFQLFQSSNFYRLSDLEALWVRLSAQLVFEDSRDTAVDDIDPGIDFEGVFGTPTLSEEEVCQLEDAIVARDLSRAHDIAQRLDRAMIEAQLHVLCLRLSRQVAQGWFTESGYLYGSTYDRTQREHTVGQVVVERQIALHKLRSFPYNLYLEDETAQQRVDQLIDHHWHCREHAQLRLQEIIEISDSTFRTARDKQQQRFEVEDYSYRVCWQQRRWLIAFLEGKVTKP